MNHRVYSLLKSVYKSGPSCVRWAMDRVRFRSSLRKALKDFLAEDELSDRRVVRDLEKDIRACRDRYQTTPQEYFLFGFRGMSDELRDTFLSDALRTRALLKRVPQDVFQHDLRNKYNLYQSSGRFFKRGVFFFSKEGTDRSAFVSFALQYKHLFLKRNDSSKGRGILSEDILDEASACRLFDRLSQDGDSWIVEEKIRQAEEMAVWNPSSVNTLRLPCSLYQGKVTVLGPFFRTGRKGSIVDNAGAGGVFACVDAATGMLNSDGVDEKGRYYEKHPDSGLAFKGWQIPRWDEAVALAEEIQRTMPQEVYVGWDLALTPDGWVLVEGNWGQFVSQYNDKKGLKHEFLMLLGFEHK